MIVAIFTNSSITSLILILLRILHIIVIKV